MLEDFSDSYLHQLSLPLKLVQLFKERFQVSFDSFFDVGECFFAALALADGARELHALCRVSAFSLLSEEAYNALRELKKPSESLSCVILRVTGQKPKKSILQFSGTWKGNDIDKVFSHVAQDREQKAKYADPSI